MKRRYHIPTRMQWNTEPSAEESTRLRQAILSAIRRAVESSAGKASEIAITDFAAQENGGWKTVD